MVITLLDGRHFPTKSNLGYVNDGGESIKVDAVALSVSAFG